MAFDHSLLMSRTIKLLNINANEKYKPLHPEWFLILKKMNFGTVLFFGIAVVSANLRNYYGMRAHIRALGISVEILVYFSAK